MRLIQKQAAFDVSTGSEAAVPTATKTPPCFTIISKTENYVSSLSSMAMPDLTYSGEIGVWILRFISVYFGSGSDVCALTRILYTPACNFWLESAASFLNTARALPGWWWFSRLCGVRDVYMQRLQSMLRLTSNITEQTLPMLDCRDAVQARNLDLPHQE